MRMYRVMCRTSCRLVVNGSNVLATGLFVEHHQNYDVQWNGNGGETIFFQNEMPYDPA